MVVWVTGQIIQLQINPRKENRFPKPPRTDWNKRQGTLGDWRGRMSNKLLNIVWRHTFTPKQQSPHCHWTRTSHQKCKSKRLNRSKEKIEGPWESVVVDRVSNKLLTASLSHCHPFTLSHCHTVTLLHCCQSPGSHYHWRKTMPMSDVTKQGPNSAQYHTMRQAEISSQCQRRYPNLNN